MCEKLVKIHLLTSSSLGMTEFINYKVDIILKDGTKSTGTISHVDATRVRLNNVIQSLANEANKKLPNIEILSNQISDLKVVQLPPELVKGRSKKKKEFGDESKRPISRSEKAPLENDLRSEIDDIKQDSEFDFAANLAIFDKKSVFADFQKNDTVSLHDRLVGHNKIDNVRSNNSTPKTTKKEKYDNDEMVLDSNRSDNWDLIGKKFGHPIGGGASRNNSTPNLHREGSVSTLKNFNFISSDKTVVPLSSPVQLLEIERLASDNCNISPSIMSEVCGSHLSQLIINKVLGGSSRLSKKNHNLPPLVVLLIGSGRCGGRAFATGRHLTNHGIRVLAYMISSNDTDEELTKQWQIFEAVGGKVITSEVSEFLTILGQLDTPVELIVDALQGYDDHLEDIFYQEQELASVRSIIKWANEPRLRNKVMSMDIPSGIDGGSGTVLDPSLQLHSRWIISMGLPIAGLSHAYKNGNLSTDDDEVTHYLVDVGIPNQVYSSKGNLRRFDKFWFTAESSVQLTVMTD